MAETATDLKTFEIKMDGGAVHLKTHGSKGTYYLCTWSIRNFSKFQNACTKGFRMEDGFTHSISVSVVNQEVKIINECRGSMCKYNLKFGVTISTDIGSVLFEKTCNKVVCCYGCIETTIVTGEEFQKLEHLPNDTFVLSCRIIRSRFDDIACRLIVDHSEYLKSLEADLKNYPSSIPNEKVLLRVGNETEMVSKAVLCVRSPVFAMMFQNDMKELNENTVHITDIKMSVVKVLVNFLSLGVIPDCDFDFLCELYYAANKYDIFELQQVCIGLLLSKITCENILRVLKLSVLHTDEILKSSATALIDANIGIISLTVEWKNFMRDNPEIALKASTFFEY